MKKGRTPAELARLNRLGEASHRKRVAERKRRLEAGWTITHERVAPGEFGTGLLISDGVLPVGTPVKEVWHAPPPKPRKKREPKRPPAPPDGRQPRMDFADE